MSLRADAAAAGRRATRVASARVTRRRRAAVVGVCLLVLVVFAAITLPRLLSGGGAAPAAAPAGGPPVIQTLPVPQFAQAASTSTSACDDPAVQSAVAGGDDEAVITALGGGAAFREAVVSGEAPCISLSDAGRRWVVVNKQRPLDPIDYTPSSLVPLTDVRSLSGGSMRADAAAALAQLASAAESAGAGEVAMLSGYRSYSTQQSTYSQHVSADGQRAADLESARPGYSEHQTGITLDLVACGNGCGGLDDFGSSSQGQWVAEHAWEYGFIIRYEDGATPITGYKAEPWHLRFVGPQLAQAYHDGGWHTLEEFFGLPAAPDYPA